MYGFSVVVDGVISILLFVVVFVVLFLFFAFRVAISNGFFGFGFFAFKV